MKGFCIKLTNDNINNPEFMEELDKAMEASQDEMVIYTRQVAKELSVSEECASDILYLRTRGRHTDQLEQDLIKLHQAGTPPNVFEFGVTKETQRNLMNMVDKQLNS